MEESELFDVLLDILPMVYTTWDFRIKFWCTLAKRGVFGSKMRFFGLLGVKIKESDTHLQIFFNILFKMLPMMYITWDLRKKFWCTLAKRGVFR